MLETIVACVERLNIVYGRGRIVGVVMDADWTGGWVTRGFGPGLGADERKRMRFNCATGTVYFAGHQMSFETLRKEES